MERPDTVLKLEHLSKRFEVKKQQIQALDDVSLEVHRGDIFGIIGFSGAGKSTLLRMVNAIERPDSGRVMVEGLDPGALSGPQLRALRKKIGMIFQQFNLLDSKTVFANVALPLLLNHESREYIQKRVTELLQFVGLEDKAHASPSRLSGGQKQRVGIARALATAPDILLCDEATSALDPQTAESILSLLSRINRELGVTILFVTHMIDVIRRLCTHVAVMESGRIIEEGEVIKVFSSPRTAVARRFVSSVIPDQIPPVILEQLRKEHGCSRLLRLRFDNANATDDVICQINQKITGLRTNVMFASVTELQGRILSVIILQLSGSIRDMDAAAAYLTEKGIAWEEEQI